MSSEDELFWVEDPVSILSSLNPFPDKSMTINERFNALTRLVIYFTAVLAWMKYDFWLNFLLVGILIIIIIRYNKMGNKNSKTEGFSVPPTYLPGSCPMTTVPPLHSEEWQVPPPVYDEYSLVPQDDKPKHSVLNPYNPKYPVFGQYMGIGNMLPHEETETLNRPLKDVQLYMNESFTRDQMAHRNEMIRVYTNKMNRIYSHGCHDMISPFNGC